MLRVIMLLSLMAVVLGGCATKTYDTLLREQFEQLPRKYSQFDMKLAWESKISDKGVTVDGVIWNVRWQNDEGLEVWVSLINPDGRVLAKEVDLIIPNSLKIDEKAHFSINLPAKPIPGSKLLFTYRYYGVDDQESAVFWMQSFESEL